MAKCIEQIQLFCYNISGIREYFMVNEIKDRANIVSEEQEVSSWE